MILIAVVEDEVEIRKEIIKNINRGVRNKNTVKIDWYANAEEFFGEKKSMVLLLVT